MDVKELRAEVRRMVMDLTEEECAEILKEMGCKYDHRRTICTLDGKEQENHQSVDWSALGTAKRKLLPVLEH